MSPGHRRDGWSGGFPPAAKPRPVAGGLVARSAHGAIGDQWWSQRFLTVLESFALGSRLSRGKNYARRGQVVSLEVGPGRVLAVVQGSRRSPYRVSIGLAAFSELVWAKTEVALAEQAGLSARLLAGELPADLEDVCAAAGAPLFPQRIGDLTMSCSCPDGVVPCKHLAATFYLLAERFDTDPFAILLWRGRDRDVLLSRLRALRGGDPTEIAADSSPVEENARVGALMALADLPSRETDFWAGSPPPPLPVHPQLPVDLLVRQLPTPGRALGGRGFLAYLEPLYAEFGDGPAETGSTDP